MNLIRETFLCSLLVLAVTNANGVGYHIKAGYEPGLAGMEHINRENCMNEETRIDACLSNALECSRTCEDGKPRTCYYSFVVERYPVSGVACSLCTPNITNTICPNCQCVLGNGVERMALTVNRMIPGPSIQVCKGDYVVVDVLNNVNSEAVTIHWHGMAQKGSAHYDGVPNLTQCPIIFKNSFRYQFKADNAGTHLWHAHTGSQKLDGIFGSFVVRTPEKQDPNSYLYSYDLANHVLIVNDWFVEETTSRYPGRKAGVEEHVPDSFLINGKGRYKAPNGAVTNVPLEVITVDPNQSFRFRFINSICSVCAAQLTIEGHALTIVASDGQDVEPTVVNSLISFAGERYDFVINTYANPGAYWIQLRGLGECEDKGIHQLAILQYVGASTVPMTKEPTFDNPLQSGTVLDPLKIYCKPDVCVTDLRYRIEVDSAILKEEPDMKLLFPIGMLNYSPEEAFKPNTYKNFLVSSSEVMEVNTLNNITLELPPSPPLSQLEDLAGAKFCNGDDMPTDCKSPVCACSHVVKIPLNSMVEVVVIDVFKVPMLSHPFHLHGFSFHVMATGQPLGTYKKNLNNGMTVDYFKQLEKEKKIVRNFDAPIGKDTFAVPNNGYAILRFKANNPGYWMFHCHQVFHQLGGMELIFQVGEPKDFPPVPKNFPKCGNFKPKISVRYSNK